MMENESGNAGGKDKKNKIEVVNGILAGLDWRRMTDQPGQYQYVATGHQSCGDPTRRIGFCVQIRKGIGAFGSDQVFLRHPNGELVVHENQSYIGLTYEQEELAESIFDSTPKDEVGSETYTCCDKIQATGYVIEGLTPGLSAQSAIVTITERHDGNTTITTIR